jgi:hypothetical protein
LRKFLVYSRTGRVLVRDHLIRRTNSEASRNNARYCCRSTLAAAEYRPCVVTARRIRAIPSAVFGPVLSPP